MRISKPLYALLSDAKAEASHTSDMIADLRDGTGHSSDLIKIRKSLKKIDAAMAEAMKQLNVEMPVQDALL